MCSESEFAAMRERIVEVEKRVIESNVTTGEQIVWSFVEGA